MLAYTRGLSEFTKITIDRKYLYRVLSQANYIIHCVPKKHVTTFSTITLTIGVRLQ